MKAIISDIHANLEALTAVLEDIDRQPVEAVYCLGDTVGYGPNPRECLDLVRQHCAVALMGNHDLAVLHHPHDFNPVAEMAVYWTRAQLEAPPLTRGAGDRHLAFLERLAWRHEEGGMMFVHGSPCDPIMEYVFPQDARNPWKMRRLFTEVERCSFQGHTHVPGIFVEPGVFVSPEDLGGTFRLGDRKVMCNVGSVGQPRDGNLRACYVLLDGNTIRWRRVAYDWQATAAKIYSAQGLDDSLGDRLVGRKATARAPVPVGV